MNIIKLFYFFSSFFILSVKSQSVLGVIELQPHQKIPVQYLIENPQQRGLLLYHSLGSGKTYVGLDYCEKNPNNKVIILLPAFLKSNWISQMASFGVKNPDRYRMLSLEEGEQLLKEDLKETIVIVDEVHRLIEKIRITHSATSELYGKIYYHLKTANKLLLLTGTPIFLETSDIAYLGNLLLEQEPYPIDAVQFKTEYMKIKPVTSLVRGHLTESKWVMTIFPFFSTLTGTLLFAASSPWVIPIIGLTGGVAIPLINEIFPANQVAFREFDTEKWKDFGEKYVSYYQVQLAEDDNYPRKMIYERSISYNTPQVNFFLDFIDQDMKLDQIKLLLADEKHSYSDAGIRFHSSKIQKQLISNPGTGREIGNLDFIHEEDKTVIESPKFLEILKKIQAQPGKVAIYSNYYQQGILRFAEFLGRNGMKDEYLILTTEEPEATQREKIKRYNDNQKRIILLHPDITEGISLMGTEQFHILEPVRNSALLEQIIGRAIRYRSHLQLPKERQKVAVYLWHNIIEYSKMMFPTQAGLTRREHWQRKYAEINPSMWTKGIVEVDSNYFLKDESPDSRVKRLEQTVGKDVAGFESLLKQFSVEAMWEKAKRKP